MLLSRELLLRPQGGLLLQSLTAGFNDTVLEDSRDPISQWYTLPNFANRGAVVAVSCGIISDEESLLNEIYFCSQS